MMRLKDVIKPDDNLFKHIKYFRDLPNVNTYYSEFILKYGCRSVASAVEELYKLDGLASIGSIFELKSDDWASAEEIKTILDNVAKNGRTVTTSQTRKSNINKTGQDLTTATDNNSVAPYDSPSPVYQDGKTAETNLTTSETVTGDNTDAKTVIYSGFNKNQIDYLSGVLNDYPAYRNYIYNDIVNMLCLQLYE